ncbi:acylating sulfoacetaldehyde dehydrogenase [Vallitalea guaymasensis]|uniref:Aldehyde dehydrogenase family protein n=1 Tax=Vallitalea guaymasensis TaxID=1185412 RepID=A0A8J8MDA3_9FIRM|nr:aldehyde dehydrogenase family protein [Vallitalea guaymasensis]QUH30842.1 aldehyde dehydrogenase family protein [Vallitalea guaymasensis]
MSDAKLMVNELITRAKKAQEVAESFTQEQVDELIKAIAWEVVQEDTAREIATLAVTESQLGNYEGKYSKLMKKVRGALRDMKDEKSVGIIERIPEKGIVKFAKPVGVIGALVPCTNPEATPVIKAMNAIKGRNAIVFAPHPRTKKTNKYIVDIMRATLKKYNAPEDLIITIEEPSLELSNELMKQCDLVVATGGSGMVKSAYSSGTPAYGVGAGNAVVIVDETADIKDAAHKIKLSKTFDYATSCSSENSLVIVESVYDEIVADLKAEGGHLVTKDEKEKLQKAMWEDGHLNRRIVAQPADKIAELAGISISDDEEFIMVEEQGVGADYPFSGEKMSIVVTLYKVKDFDQAVDKVNEITGYQGTGHSCGIHTTDQDRVEILGNRVKVSRIMVRQPQCYANSGNWDNGMPFTLTLGCGTWGGNVASENVTWKHFINVTWVSTPIQEVIPTDEELFGDLAI